jgi:LacI family transcriptional regulator
VVTLRFLADQLGLSPASISLVLNHAPAAAAIPRTTQQRIRDIARRFDYRPNAVARSLRRQRSLTVGVMLPEISEGYGSAVMRGVEDYLLQEGYLYFVASHRHRADLLEEYTQLMLARAVEGLLAIDTPCPRPIGVPVVAVSGHDHTRGVTNVVLNHDHAASIGLEHLIALGHRRIAFIKGQSFSSDTATRWNAIARAARRLKLRIDPKLVVQLEGDSPSPDLGYLTVRELLDTGVTFSALFAFNDISAIGAMRALRERNLRVPEDVSVLGFDDIQTAEFQNPPLSTIRQPLRRMGEIAAETLLQRIAATPCPRQISVDPELVARQSTGGAPEAIGRSR